MSSSQAQFLENDIPLNRKSLFFICLLWPFNNNLEIILLSFPIRYEIGKGRKISPTAKSPWRKHTKLINRSKVNM